MIEFHYLMSTVLDIHLSFQLQNHKKPGFLRFFRSSADNKYCADMLVNKVKLAVMWKHPGFLHKASFSFMIMPTTYNSVNTWNYQYIGLGDSTLAPPPCQMTLDYIWFLISIHLPAPLKEALHSTIFYDNNKGKENFLRPLDNFRF